jgi:lipopolysaccharide export system permease protein
LGVAARYINRELVAVFLVTVLVLLLVAVGGRFIGYLQDAVAGKYAAETLITILQLRLPEFLQVILPFALYLSLLLTLSRLHAESEMVVLQTGGLGTLQLLTWNSRLVQINGLASSFSNSAPGRIFRT